MALVIAANGARPYALTIVIAATVLGYVGVELVGGAKACAHVVAEFGGELERHLTRALLPVGSHRLGAHVAALAVDVNLPRTLVC